MRCVLLSCLLLPFFVFSQQIPQTSKVQELKTLIPSLIKQGNIPGLSIVLLKNGEVMWSQAFGYSNNKTKALLTTKNVFEGGSLGKPLFAYAVMRLAELGRIDLNKPLIEYYPEKYAGDTQRLKKITAITCLTHTTGFPDQRPVDGVLKFYHNPGEKFSYSGEGIRYLQKAIEYKEGKGLNEIMNELIFKPLAMTSSSYTWRSDFDILKVYPHDFLGMTKERHKPGEASAVGSLHTTASDYSKFLKSLLKKDLLQSDSYKKMLTAFTSVEEDCIECLEKGRRKLSKELSWGLGIGLQQSEAGKEYWHWEDNGNMQAFFLGKEDSKDGIVIFGNSANLLSVVEKIVNTAFDEDLPAVSWLKIVPYNRSERLAFNSILTTNKVDKKAIANLTYNQLNWVAFTLLKAEKIKEAIEVLKTRIDSSSISDSYYALALAYMMSDNYDAAKEYSRKSATLNASNTDARELLLKLEDETRIIAPSILKQYAGQYNTPFGPADISVTGGKLYLKIAEYPVEKLVAKNETTFLANGYGFALNFEKDKDKVKGFSFMIGNEKKEALKYK